ncbi:Cell wall integrity and stress response component 4 [Neonectria magnoliae]|uniref:Cell wall integrity and stress response component 4 n=1 Tax=Neonectria magnoliae TaxID=2732573 RepID=A0ABR1HKV9_9HYPO
MFPFRQSAQTLGVLFLLATPWSPVTTALDVDICASFNTGSTDRNTSIYQTNGLCHDFCIDDYAFAITQANSCWCSNYAPAKSEQESVSSCDTPCPAYPAEDCGGDGLYGYLSLGGVLPSGTQGADSSSTTEATTTAPISKVTETVQHTVTVVSSETPTTESTTSSSSDETSTESETTETTETAETTEITETSESTSESSTSTADENQPTSEVQTVTAGGTVRTVTIGPTSTGTTASENAGVRVKSSDLGTGQVVGIVVGVIGAVIIAASLALFLWFRRRKQRNQQEGFQDDPSIRDSSSGIRPDMSVVGASPSSPNAASKRNSTLQVDPRMDPFKQGLYVRGGSHESINTLGDEHDYSRRIQAPKVLRATNPDP